MNHPNETDPLSPFSSLAGAVVASVAPEAREVSATCWQSSQQYYEQAFEVASLAALRDPVLARSLARLVEEGPTPSGYRQIRDRLTALSHDSGSDLADAALRIEEGVRLTYLSTCWSRVLNEQPRENAPAVMRRPVGIVIPFRSRDEGDRRLRNLWACLSALSDQSIPRQNYRIIVAEADSFPRHEAQLTHLIDDYVFLPDEGEFNKAAAVNAGCARAAARSSVFALLDADIVVDHFFIERCMEAMIDPKQAMLPYQDAFCLDRESSDRIAVDVSGCDELNGYRIHHPPGGSVWVTADAFHAIGGFDERYVGWGGEDRDFIDRLAKVCPVPRAPGLLIHLQHARPNMPSDRMAIHGAAQRRGPAE